MYRLLCVLMFVAAGDAGAVGLAQRIGPSSGSLPNSTGASECGTVAMNSDGSYEWAYAWQYGGVLAPNYGAFAECRPNAEEVCAVVLDLTSVSFPTSIYTDIYVWSDAGGVPGTVLRLESQVEIPQPAYWPDVSRHTIVLTDPVCTDGAYWLGYWGTWPGQDAAYYVGADLNGPGGCPRTNIAPGIGYPTGWQNVSVAFGPTAALGIGAEVLACVPVPVKSSSWGRVKSLFR